MRYRDHQFIAAHDSGARTARAVAAFVGCSLSTARRRMVREVASARATLARISQSLRLAVLAMEWEERDDYTCAMRERNPLRGIA